MGDWKVTSVPNVPQIPKVKCYRTTVYLIMYLSLTWRNLKRTHWSIAILSCGLTFEKYSNEFRIKIHFNLHVLKFLKLWIGVHFRKFIYLLFKNYIYVSFNQFILLVILHCSINVECLFPRYPDTLGQLRKQILESI